jgi:preprotein translocase subunit SecG
MSTVLLIVHLFVTLALIGVVLIQRSEGGGLGVGGGGGGMGSFMSGRGTANLLTRTTSILAAIFFTLSLTLALLNRGTTGVAGSILEPKGGEAIPAAPIGTAPAPLAPPAPGSDTGPGDAPATAPTAAPAPGPATAPLTGGPGSAPTGPLGGSTTAPVPAPSPPPHSGPSVPIN